MDLPETDSLVREAVCELANQIVGNAVATLNDQGFHFRVHPPVLHTADGAKSTEDTEALVLCFETCIGNVFYEYCAALQLRSVPDPDRRRRIVSQKQNPKIIT